MKKVALVSLGCAKNLVDSEVMLGVLKKAGFSFVGRPREADIIIVNTCGFIQPARDEAARVLGNVLRIKKRNPGITVVAAGCYVERDEAALRERFPAVDAWTGVRDFVRIAGILEGGTPPRAARVFLYSDKSPRLVSTGGTWAYIKVSEGCSHHCGFCAIPLIKGPYVSRSAASIVREARALAGLGIKEINLISHDTTFYGRDRGRRDGLVRLLERLVRVEGVEWIRLLYGYPEEVTNALLDTMREEKICRYLDIPFQHTDAALLKAMKRSMDGARALDFLARIRARVPGVVLRTSLIVGFPGEGRREFAALRRFVEKARFDHLGVFTYSPEMGTDAFARPETVSPAEKEARRSEIMSIQAEISRARNGSYVGQALDVLIEQRVRPGSRTLTGRTRFQAPEVDGRVLLSVPRGAPGPLGPIVSAEITSAGPYDLRGRLVA
ncbi:MAG: 30S ribosomal protein S12 methylthiotransferase RimO [Candidatus Aminicenantales bacterium]